jgi:hypothetical protein
MEESNRSKGLGDSVEKLTKATGVKSLMSFAAHVAGNNDCGCNKRRDWLNQQFPYKNK